MSRILRFGILGLVCALPLAIPQASQAAGPRCFYGGTPTYTRFCRPNGWYHYHWNHGRGYHHGHHRR